MSSITNSSSHASPPVGEEDFRELIDNEFLFVDKTLLIKEFLDNKNIKVSLITRPRRFGKTLNLSMLHHFFAEKIKNKSTKGLFDGLKISEAGEEYMAHQGQYPVIFLTFKGIQSENPQKMIRDLKSLMKDIYHLHYFLLESSHLTKVQKKDFYDVLYQKIDETDLEKALFRLTEYLYTHYQKEVIVLIDEYDAPIQAGYFNNYYQEAIKMMRGLLGSCFKTNPYLERALLTGITRVSKESLFSGLNNLKVHSLLDKKYQEHFGFTEEEVNMLADKMGYQDKLAEMKAWYNGYKIGEATLYNPWSIINCLDNDGLIKNYWLNTSGNELIKKLLINSSADFKEDFEQLLRGKSIRQSIREDMVFGDLKEDESLVWSLFFVAGYLKIVASSEEQEDESINCELKIPNQEIRIFYSSLIKKWLRGDKSLDWYNTFIKYLLIGNVEKFEANFQQILANIVSVYDVAPSPEVFYHGLVLGLVVTLNHYEIKSNRESGKGRYDIAVIPRDPQALGLLFELKSVEETTTDAKLAKQAQKALQQIDDKNYVAEFRQRGIHKVLKIALVFKGKDFQLKYVEENLQKAK